MEEESLNDDSGIRVSMFDYSVDNHLRAMDKISNLCGEPEADGLDESDIQRLSSSVTFLREWRQFNYEPRIVKFATESEGSQGKAVSCGVNLPQFSSSTVPKEVPDEDTASPDSCNDFVMYVGGSVWALDWCPRVHEYSENHVKCEFIAVAAHPPESYYHKIGALLTGRGLIQIWCMLNVQMNEETGPASTKKQKRGSNNKATGESSMQLKKPRGRPRKKPIDETLEDQASKIKKPRGRPRKKPIGESFNDMQLVAVENPEGSVEPISILCLPGNTEENALAKADDKERKCTMEAESASSAAPKASVQSRRLKSKARTKSFSDNTHLPLSMQNKETESSSIANQKMHCNFEQGLVACNNILDRDCLDISLGSSIPSDIALPRIVLCLAHNGKVAWDVKWQPHNANDSKCKLRMGYLAVLLGNGSLEVWEIPLPRTMGVIYSASLKEGTDPRFVKLEPVFRCSKLKCGGIQSIPLTVEWSTSSPHDYLLAGCHDGTVALWKFSASSSPEDTRPVLCFSADTLPIRSIAWAPSSSDMETSNVIVTAGHGGLKFWDIRDPFHHLWEVHPGTRFIYSLDWLGDPNCVFLSFDDGTMRLLSIVQAACDVPVTGKSFTGWKQLGLHLYNCSSFAIWSVQVSRPTGMVAYCSADGSVVHFQLTHQAVEKEFSRNRTPHFLCGSLTEEESAITINTPSPNMPLTLKKPVNDCGESQKAMRDFLKQPKSAKDKKAEGRTSDNETLVAAALCYENDPSMDSESEETLAALSKRTKPKSKSSSKNKAEDQPLTNNSKELTKTEGKDDGNAEAALEVEAFPPKTVAIHKVRWNMNKGSERWLCYGGAAGIVRCQEIVVPDVGKKPRRRKKENEL